MVPLQQKWGSDWRETTGRVTAYTDANGATTKYEYRTLFSTPNRVTNAEGDWLSYELDEGGRILSREDANGVTRYGYNALDFLSSVVDPLGHRHAAPGETKNHGRAVAVLHLSV